MNSDADLKTRALFPRAKKACGSAQLRLGTSGVSQKLEPAAVKFADSNRVTKTIRNPLMSLKTRRGANR